MGDPLPPALQRPSHVADRPRGTAGSVPKEAAINNLPHSALLGMGLCHPVRWVSGEAVPPRAPPIEVSSDGGLFAKNEQGTLWVGSAVGRWMGRGPATFRRTGVQLGRQEPCFRRRWTRETAAGRDAAEEVGAFGDYDDRSTAVSTSSLRKGGCWPTTPTKYERTPRTRSTFRFLGRSDSMRPQQLFAVALQRYGFPGGLTFLLAS